MVINSLTMTFSLPEEKVSAIDQKATLLTNKSQVLVREIYQFIGMCSAARLAVKEAPIHYRQLRHQVITLLKENLLLRNQCYSVKVILLPLALQDLDWWIHNLSASISNPIILPHPDISIQTDSSDLRWGGYLKPLRTSGMWTRSQLFWHINRKELMANFLSLKFFLKSQENVHVQIMTDNSTSVSYLNRMGGTKSVTLSNLALDIWRWSLRKAVYISAVHVAGLLNISRFQLLIHSDPLSRFQLLSTEWMLCKRIFQQIVAVYGCPQIDLFASSRNHQLKTYCSWIADPKALKIDAFTFSWDFNLVYLFPLFPLIHKCLSKIKKDNCRTILIAPVWKSRPWYPIILGMLMDCPALLPIRKDLLQLPLSNETHPLLTDRKRNFKLAAWPVSGNPSDSIKFLKGCPKLSLHHGGRVQKSITSLPGVNSIAGVKNDQLIRFLVL